MTVPMLGHYRTIGEIQSCIAHAETLDEALQGGLRIIVDFCGAANAILWYPDKAGDGRLHPYYWIGPVDLTSRYHEVGRGVVGRVYAHERSENLLDFETSPARDIAGDFEGMEVASVICVPLTTTSETIGCIELVNRTNGGLFTEEDADIVEIMAMMAGIAISDNEQIADPWEPGRVLMSMRGITREFDNPAGVVRVLNGVNLDVYEGEFLVLLGESGCGKSTLLNIIGGMDRPTSGTFTFDGVDLSNASQAQLTELRRDNIGFIFQSYNLMPNLNARQNLQLIAELVENPLDVADALRIVGLENRMGSYPSQLSGGQQQRVSIARALVKNPKVILADEPTAALDYATSIEVLTVLEKVVHEGSTMVMVTHNEQICRLADRVVRMRGGRVWEVTVNRHPAHAADLVW